jgi:hypothetical protein
MIQNLHRVLFTQGGKLKGMTTKRDIVGLLSADFPAVGALAEKS